MRRTRSTSQMESGVPLSRVALRSRLVGPCKETALIDALREPGHRLDFRLSAYSKWLRAQNLHALELASHLPEVGRQFSRYE